MAAMVVGVMWLLIREYTQQILAGASDAELRAALLRLGKRSFALLHAGAADYCTRAIP